MNARVFVLVLATGLFMAVWNADQRFMKVQVAKHYPTRVIVSGTKVPEALQIAAVEVESDVIPDHVMDDENTREQPKPLPEPDSARESRDSAELDAMLTTEEGENTDGLLPEGASGKVAPMSVINSETESLTDSAPTFTSVDDVIVFGVPGEEPVEGSDSEKASGQRPVSSHRDLLLETFDRLISALSSDVHEPASILPAADEAAAASVHSSLDDAPLTKEAIRPIIPVPRDLPAGVWNVLSQSGDTFRMTIERTSPGPESADRFCLSSSLDGDRWCFVRAAEQTVSVEQTASSLQICTEFWPPTEKQ